MKRLIVLVVAVLALLPGHFVFADTETEYVGCIGICNDQYVTIDSNYSRIEAPQYQSCINQCKEEFPNGYQARENTVNNNTSVGLTIVGGNCPNTSIKLNVPLAGKTCISDFATYFQTIYSFILGAVAILSTVMIMWGGFKWLTSRGSSGDIGEAKKIITSSIIGLVLAFLSFTILYLVNPKLTVIGLPQLKTVNLEVNEAKLTPLTTQNYQHPTTAPGKWNSGTYTQDEQAVRTALTGPDIGATIQGNNPPCVDSNGNQISYQSYLAQNNNNHCTTLASLPNTAIEGLKKIRSSCPNCELEITGGTELGHDEHGAGRAVVDLDTNGVLDVYINKFPVENGRHTLPGGGTALNEGDHWHLEY